ncbi:MAG: hypothetical protein HZA31_00810 [Opitutae bacterium]|nr:hypothetical protein [Opitutae bacterium]
MKLRRPSQTIYGLASNAGLALIFAVLGACGARLAAEESTPATSERIVELPPLLVEESKAPPWHYVAVTGAEFLSRCKDDTTEEFVCGWLRAQDLLKRILPPEFHCQMSVPHTLLLYSQSLKSSVSREVINEMVAQERQRPKARRRPDAIGVMPNMRLNDRDAWASFVFLDEKRAPEIITCTSYHVLFVLDMRTPQLPPWFISGFVQLFEDVEFLRDALRVNPTRWLSDETTKAILLDPDFPRALLPMQELLATAPRITDKDPDWQRQLWRSQAALFIRWALDKKAPQRAAGFWKFVSRTCTEPLTEALFQECFGMDFADARDRLSDYLPTALRQSQLFPGEKFTPPPIKLRPATDSEIARIKGDWERLEIGYVQRRFPALVEKYRDQAQHTLERSYNLGARDPRLQAALGLFHCDTKNPAMAREYLEAAVAARVTRPRAYYELAQLYLREVLAAPAGTNGKLSGAQAAPILELLLTARAQSPQLPEIYLLIGAIWERCADAPTAYHLAIMEEGARLFPRHPSLGALAALQLIRNGQTDRAAALIDFGLSFALVPESRALFEKLRSFLPHAP